MPDKLTDKEIVNPCYLCKHPNEKPNRRKHYKCNNEECEWLKCWARVKELEEENNRLQAEIEQLKKSNEMFTDIGKLYSEIKAEAYKEFAERLEKRFALCYGMKIDFIHASKILDNLLKELVGEG